MNQKKKSHYLASAVQTVAISPAHHVFQANWAISPHNGKNNPHYFWIRKDLWKELSPQNCFDVFFFFLKFLLCRGDKWRKVCVWIRTYSSGKLISSLGVIMEQCFPVTVDGITFSWVTKAGSFLRVYVTIWYDPKSEIKFTFAVFSMHEIRF